MSPKIVGISLKLFRKWIHDLRLSILCKFRSDWMKTPVLPSAPLNVISIVLLESLAKSAWPPLYTSVIFFLVNYEFVFKGSIIVTTSVKNHTFIEPPK